MIPVSAIEGPALVVARRLLGTHAVAPAAGAGT